jgi:release factor glutamine methyltransferase
MLARRLAEEAPLGGKSVLDLCTGSGLLAVVAARNGASPVVAVDVSRRALWSAWLNAALNGVEVQTARGDLFGAVRGRQFDLIVSNPPYLPGDVLELPRRGAERAWEGGPSGRIFLDRICVQVYDYLRPGGAILLLHSSVCNIPQTLSALAARGLSTEIVMSHRGPLGPVLASRADWLRRRGLVGPDGLEEVVIIRAQRPVREPESRGGARVAAAGAA